MKRSTKALLWIIGILVLLVVVGLSIPTLTRVCVIDPFTRHISNARQLITALRIYSSDQVGNYPQSLDDLVKEGVIERDVLDKFMRYDLAPDGKPREWIVNLDLADSDPGYLPLVIAPEPTKDGKYIIGMNDGSVGTENKKGYDELMERLMEFREGRGHKPTAVKADQTR